MAHAAEKRREAFRLRDQAGVRDIARRLDVSPATVSRWLRGPAPQPVPNIQDENGKPVAGAENGNGRALTHGAYSETRLEPLAETHLERLREHIAASNVEPHPAQDPAFTAALEGLAVLLARAHRLRVWIDEAGELTPSGDVRAATVFEAGLWGQIGKQLAALGLTPDALTRQGVNVATADAMRRTPVVIPTDAARNLEVARVLAEAGALDEGKEPDNA